MAAEGGPPGEHISYLESIAREVRRYGVLTVLRNVEARAPKLERIGEGRRPEQIPVDIAHYPGMDFPGPTIEEIEFRRHRPTIVGRYLGLTGPMGPLPHQMTEFAYDERRYRQSHRPFGRWLDLIANRMLQFFYRAWADTQPLAEAERPERDRHAAHVAALSGAGEGVPTNAAFPLRDRLRYAAVFASRRSAVAIEDAMTHLLAIPCEVHEFQPRWLKIEDEDLTRLGEKNAVLGIDASVGDQFWSVSDAFLLQVATRDLREFEAMLPTGRLFPVAAEALDTFAPSYLDWEIRVTIAELEIEQARLDGSSRLGWTAWIATKRDSERRRSDVHLSRKHRHRTQAPKGAIDEHA